MPMKKSHFILLPWKIEPPIVQGSKGPRGGKWQTSKGQKRCNAGRPSVVRHWQNALTATAVDIGRGEVEEAFVVTPGYLAPLENRATNELRRRLHHLETASTSSPMGQILS